MSRSGMRSSASVASIGITGALRNDPILYINILSARDLVNTQKVGVQDPFCAVYLSIDGRVDSKPVFKTATHDNGGTDPQWHEKTTILIPDVSTGVLIFKILNENWIGSNTIGEVAVALRDLSRGRSMEREFALTPSGFLKTSIYLSLNHENPTSHMQTQVGDYPQHFIPGKTKLYIGLVSATKLRDVQTLGTQDPYCEVYLSRSRNPGSQDLVYKSKTHDNGGKNPSWTEGFTVVVRCIDHDYITFRIMNDNRVRDTLIGEASVKTELLIGRQFEDKSIPVEAEDTIVGQIRLQLALFNDEVLENDISDGYDQADFDGCTCKSNIRVSTTKVGNVLINGIQPDGVHYRDAGTVVHTGCDLAGDYVMEKDMWEGDEF